MHKNVYTDVDGGQKWVSNSTDSYELPDMCFRTSGPVQESSLSTVFREKLCLGGFSVHLVLSYCLSDPSVDFLVISLALPS